MENYVVDYNVFNHFDSFLYQLPVANEALEIFSKGYKLNCLYTNKK